MRPRGCGEEVLRLRRFPAAVERLQQRQRHAFVVRALGEQRAHAPDRLLRLARLATRQRRLQARVEGQRGGLDAEERR